MTRSSRIERECAEVTASLTSEKALLDAEIDEARRALDGLAGAVKGMADGTGAGC